MIMAVAFPSKHRWRYRENKFRSQCGNIQSRLKIRSGSIVGEADPFRLSAFLIIQEDVGGIVRVVGNEIIGLGGVGDETAVC